jgi:hypothetical protein
MLQSCLKVDDIFYVAQYGVAKLNTSNGTYAPRKQEIALPLRVA